MQTATGRVFRLRAKQTAHSQRFDYGTESSRALVEKLSDGNKWVRRTALRLLANRRDASATPQLHELLASEPGQTALEALWALNLIGALDDRTVDACLDHAHPHVRLWAVRLACDDGDLSATLAERFAELAQRESQVEVRSQLACSARRLPAAQAVPIVRQLIAHDEDVDDPYVPLLIWWAIEKHCQKDREAVLSMFAETPFWEARLVKSHLASRLMRRFAQAGSRQDLLTCAELLKRSPNAECTRLLLVGFEEAFAGRSLASLPEELVNALSESGQASLALRLRQRQPEAIAEAIARLANAQAETSERREIARMFGEVQTADAVAVLLELTNDADAELRKAAIGSLQRYDAPEIPTKLIARLPDLSADAQPLALSVLTSRPRWTRSLLEAIQAGAIDVGIVPAALVSNILLQRDEANAALVRAIWGDKASAAAAELSAEVTRLTALVHDGHGSPYEGRKLFHQHCAKCHKLYDHGGEIGPDLTAYQRDNVDRLLAAVVNPSAEIREGFENFVLQTTDGRTLTGFLADQDNQVVVLRTAEGQNVTVPRTEIEELRAAGQSLMPEGLLKSLSDAQARDLFAYLRGTQPLAVDD